MARGNYTGCGSRGMLVVGLPLAVGIQWLPMVSIVK